MVAGEKIVRVCVCLGCVYLSVRETEKVYEIYRVGVCESEVSHITNIKIFNEAVGRGGLLGQRGWGRASM